MIYKSFHPEFEVKIIWTFLYFSINSAYFKVSMIDYHAIDIALKNSSNLHMTPGVAKVNNKIR